MSRRRDARKDRSEPAVGEATHFSAGHVRDLTAIVRAAGVLPRPATVFLEGTSTSPETRAFLEAHAGAPGRDDLRGTRSRSTPFHLPLTDELVDGLCALADRQAGPEVCDHIVVYSDSEVLMAAYDAGDDDVWLARSLPSAERRQAELLLHGTPSR